MSMILDALKRADRERRRHEVELPNLESEHHPEPQHHKTQARQSWRRTALVALTLLALGAAIGLSVSSVRTADVVPAGSAPDHPAPSASAAPDARPAPSAERAGASNPSPTAIAQLYQSKQTPPLGSPSEVRRLYQQPEPAEPARPQSQSQKTGPVASSEPARISLAEPRETATVRLNAPERDSTADTTAPTVEPEPEPAPEPQAEPSKTQSIRELSWAMQQKIPSINYQAHRYQQGRNSTVTLNKKERRPGDEVSAGIRVEQIEEDGVVLSYQGEKFKLKALNSWVNM